MKKRPLILTPVFLAAMGLWCSHALLSGDEIKTGAQSPLLDDLRGLDKNNTFNRKQIRSYTSYESVVNPELTEREISFHVVIDDKIPRQGDVFPVYRIPSGKMAWLSDWSFNINAPRGVSGKGAGGSLGRIIADGHYVYVLNCAAGTNEMQIYSPSQPIRYLPEQWIAVCFHQLASAGPLACRATFRFTEVPAPKMLPVTRLIDWWAPRQ